MCAALLLPNCRDAFLRLSQLPSLRDRRFYSAILLAETQECVSTTFRRTHVNLRANLAPKLRWQGIYVRILPQNFAGKVSQRDSCPKSSLGRYRGAILAPNPRWEGVAARFLPHAERREDRDTVSWPKPFGGKLETLFPDPNYSAARYRGAILAPRGAAGKNCRTILVPRGTAERNCRTILVSPERRQAGDNEQSCPTGIVGTRLGAR